MVSARGRPLISPPHFAFFILGFLATAHGTSHDSQDSDRCFISCLGSGGSNGFEEGNIYRYKFEGSSRMRVGATPTDLSPLDISAVASITPLSKCTFYLQLDDVRLSASNKALENELLQNGKGGIIAGLDSTGKLNAEVCSPADQSNAYTNLHRAVLSLLQSYKTKIPQPQMTFTRYESDIYGYCKTDYTATVNETNREEIIVDSTRHLDKCDHREDARVPIITSPYQKRPLNNLRVNFKDNSKTRVLKGSQKGKQTFSNEELQESKSWEVYTLAPNIDENAATITVNSQLTLVSKTESAIKLSIDDYKERTLLFQANNDDGTDVNYDDLKNTLSKLCDGSTSSVKSSNPRDFIKFVTKLSNASKLDISNLIKAVKDGEHFNNRMNAWRVLLDGLYESTSSTSVEIMSELLINGSVEKEKAKSWIMSFSKANVVTTEAIIAAKGVLEKEIDSFEANLGIGALIGKFCAQNQCENVDVVEEIEEMMSRNLIKSCSPGDMITENKIIAGLKGLGNIHHLSDKVAKRLSDCALDKNALARIRIYILEIMKTDPKKKIIQESVKKILQDVEEDSEVRIKAYLTLMENPSREVADIIVQILSKEDFNQVSGFIHSHLVNIKRSTNPDNLAAAYHFMYMDNFPSDKFRREPMKFSRNYLMNYHTDAFGGEAETNMIYSTESYLPRSLSFNLTTYLYGNSYNLFEIGLRTENLEKIYQKILNTLVFKRQTVNDVLKNGTDLMDHISNSLNRSIGRSKRDTMEKLKEKQQNMKKTSSIFHDEFLMDLSVKSLGAEIGFYSHYGDNINPHRPIDNFFNELQYSIDKAKNFNVEYSKHSTFFDGEIIYPTGLGLPLKVKTRGSAAFGLSAQANVDVPKFMSDGSKRPHNMKFKLIPSGVVEVIGSLTIDTGPIETGVEVTLSAQSSTGGEAALKILKGKELEIVIGVPLKEQKVFSVSTGLNTIFRENNKVFSTPVEPDIDAVSIEDYSGCFEQLSKITGLTFCGGISIPNNDKPTINPFYGPSNIFFEIQLEDDTITSYLFKANLEEIKERNKFIFNMLLDTPGSKIDRKIFIGYESETNRELKKAKLMLESYWKSLLIEGSLLMNEKEMSVSGKVINDESQYTTKVGLIMNASSNTVTQYKPFFDYSSPEEDYRLPVRSKSSSTIKLFGDVLVERKESEGITNYLFNKVTLEMYRSNYTVDGAISSQFKGESSKLSSDVKIIYDEEYVTINASISRPDSTQLEGDIIVFPSQNPLLAFSSRLKLECVVNQDFKFLSEFDFTHGPDSDNKDMRFTFNNHVLISGIKEKNVQFIAIKHHIVYPPVDLLFESDLEWLPRNLKYSLVGKFDQSSADLKITVSTDPAGPYDIFIAAMIMQQGFKLDMKRELLDNYRSKFTNSLELTPGRLFQVNALVSHKMYWSDLELGLQGEIKTPLQPKHIRLSTGIQNNKEKMVGQFFLEADTKVFTDLSLERVKGSQSRGKLKFYLSNYVDSKGDFGFQDSALKGSAYIIFLKSKSKVDAVIDMIMRYPKYSGTIVLNSKMSPNNIKTIKIETDTNLENGIFDTKNKLINDGKESLFNFKFQRTGNNNKGTINSDFEIKLADDDHLMVKFNRNLSGIPGDAEGIYNLEMSHKATIDSNPTELVMRLAGKHVDFNQGKIDGQLTVKYASPDGKDTVIQLSHKKIPQDDKWNINFIFDVFGSMVESPLKIKIETETSRSLPDSSAWFKYLPPSSYKIFGSFGKNMNLESYGKIKGNTFSGEITVKLPSTYRLSFLKWSTINLIQFHPELDDMRQVKSSNVFKWNQEFFEIDSDLLVDKDEAKIKFDWETEQIKKRSFLFQTHWQPIKQDSSYAFDMSFKYDKDGKPTDGFLKFSNNVLKGDGNFHFHGTCPANGVYDYKIAFKTFNYGKGRHSEWIFQRNNKTTKGLYKVNADSNHPHIEYYIEDENNSKSGFLIKADKKGLSEWTGNVHIEWSFVPERKIFFYVNSAMKLVSIDNFLVKVEANSNRYQLENLLLEIFSDPSHLQQTGTKRVNFKMTHKSKVILNGTGMYNLNSANDDTYTFESDGEAMVGESLKPISLKLIWKPSPKEKMFNGSVSYGETKLSVEGSHSNKLTYYSKYCDPSIAGECSEAKFTWATVKTGPEQEETTLQMMLDKNYLNINKNVISFDATFERNGTLISQNVQLNLKKMYKYTLYIFDDEAGLTIVLPERTLSGVISFVFPNDVKRGKLFIEGNLWLNKINEPNKKTYLLISGEISSDIEFYEYITEVKLSHPTLSKDFGIKGKGYVKKYAFLPLEKGVLEFDIFNRPEDKLILTLDRNDLDSKTCHSSSVKLKSKGLKIDLGYNMNLTKIPHMFGARHSVFYFDQSGTKRESSLNLAMSSRNVSISVRLPEVTVYEFFYTIDDTSDSKVTFTGNYKIAGKEYKENVSSNTRTPSINYQFHFGQGRIFSMNFDLALNKSAQFQASFGKSSLFQMEVSLSKTDFLKITHNYNNYIYRKLIETIAGEATGVIKSLDKEIKREVERDGREVALLMTKLGNAMMDPSPLFISYQEDMRTILTEIIENDDIAELLPPAREALSSFVEKIVEIMEEFLRLTSHFRKAVQEALNYSQSLMLVVATKVKETSISASSAISSMINSSIDAYLRFNDRLFKEIEKYNEEIQTISSIVSDFSQDLGKHIYNFVDLAKKELENFVRESWEAFKCIPLFQILEEKFQELKNYKFSEGFWPDIKEIIKNIEDSAPNPELKKLISSLTNYVDQFLKEEKVDLDAVTRQILREFIDSIEPTLISIREALYYDTLVIHNQIWVPVPGLSIWREGASKYLQYGDFGWLFFDKHQYVIFSEYMAPFRTSIKKLLPPYKGRAYIGGTQIVTFDGQAVSLSNGVYVLAQELNGMFTIIATVENNKMVSIELIQDNIRMKYTEDGKLWMNDQVIEHTTNNGFGKPSARYSLSGGNLETEQVSVICRWNLNVCIVVLKPMSFAKVRGILGTYNYERFDDFTLPNGKISQNETDFVNNWNIQTDNEDNAKVSLNPNKQCTDYFSLYKWALWPVDPTPFMKMCHGLVSEATTMEERRKAFCFSMFNFVKESRANNIVFDIVPPCDVCEVDGETVTTDEFKIMKTPSKKADIVFLIDLNKNNSKIYETLIRPLTEQLEKKLGSKGITDVDFGLIGFGSLNLTNINYFKVDGKLQMKKHLPSSLPWDDGSIPKFVNTFSPNCKLKLKMDQFWETVDKYFIANDQTERGVVRKEISQAYPWRPGSVRSIISLVSSPCPLPEPILSPLTRIKTAQKLMEIKSNGIIYNLITPVSNLKLSSGRTNDVIGFTSDEAFLLKDYSSGQSAKDRKEALTYSPDTCHQFALETGGNVFVSDNLKNGNGVEAVSTLLTTSMVAEEKTFHCQCNIKKGLHPKYECTVQRQSNL